MQPTYQVPWSKLERTFARLKEILGDVQAQVSARKFDRAFARQELLCSGQNHRAFLLLFLCGLRFEFGYFRASENAQNGLRQVGAGHLLDDCLAETCDRGLRSLMEIAKSRRLRETVSEFLKPSVNTELLLLGVAFAELQEKLPVTVTHWIEHGERESNCIRFCFGMGVRSLWARESCSFVHKMMRKPLGFANARGESCTAQIKAVMDGFEWNPQWVLPEV
jgi:hypothetical protein